MDMNGFQIVSEALIRKPPNLVDLKRYDFKLRLYHVKEELGENTILLVKMAADALLKAQSQLPDPDYRFIVSSGFRSYEAQVRVNDIMKKQLQKSNPNNWEKILDTYTGGEKYLEYLRNTPPNKLSRMSHASGYAVDVVGIYNKKTKKELDMANQKEFNDKRDQLYHFPETTEAGKNRRMFAKVMIANGFKNYKEEWWHWGYYK
jgi:D-alanyl-D-alanine dipeptidase